MSIRKTGFNRVAGNVHFMVYRNSDLDEFSVRVKSDVRGSGFREAEEYFASDKADAEMTCIAMHAEQRKKQLRSNNEELAVVVNKCQLLQKLWDSYKLMSGTLREIGRNLDKDDIGPHNRQYYADKALNTSEFISDGKELCAMLHKAGVNL